MIVSVAWIEIHEAHPINERIEVSKVSSIMRAMLSTPLPLTPSHAVLW